MTLPYFHSCSNTLDFPRYESREVLADKFKMAMANGEAGGFGELEKKVEHKAR